MLFFIIFLKYSVSQNIRILLKSSVFLSISKKGYPQKVIEKKGWLFTECCIQVAWNEQKVVGKGA